MTPEVEATKFVRIQAMNPFHLISNCVLKQVAEEVFMNDGMDAMENSTGYSRTRRLIRAQRKPGQMQSTIL